MVEIIFATSFDLLATSLIVYVLASVPDSINLYRTDIAFQNVHRNECLIA